MNNTVILLTGIPASGKSTFYKTYFFPEYVYISLDQLKSRSAEQELFSFCLRRDKHCVIDNTNITRAQRQVYIRAAKASGARVVGYCFVTDKDSAIERNTLRSGRASVPEVAIRAMYQALEYPQLSEGYDELYFVRMNGAAFDVENYDENYAR